jgi:hypothetical protein
MVASSALRSDVFDTGTRLSSSFTEAVIAMCDLLSGAGS